ncbi:MAG: glycosyltransferase family 1 protein, partial [Magnetococcales bacterium]|nr:glycosyltransferase family 1 protein [Magnetococcales bacterium]
VHAYGNNWDQFPDMKEAAKGSAQNGNMLNNLMNRSKICISNSPGTTLHMRALEIMGSRSFMLSKWVPEAWDNSPIKRYFSEEDGEVVFFNNEHELLELVQRYLPDEQAREKVAEASYKKVVETLSYKSIADSILETVRRSL